METNKEKIISQGQIYLVDGKEWIVGERKISMFDKAKCNKILTEKKADNTDNTDNTDRNKEK
jgi:hypothetical protein